jgi:hypothetical protein
VSVVINVCGTIDEEAASRVAAQMRAAAGRDVELRIDSHGGKLWGAILVALEIEEHNRAVTSVVVGEASSAAALIAMSADFRRIDRRGAMLVHWPRPRSVESGLDVLRAITGYSGQPSRVVRGWLDEEQTSTPKRRSARASSTASSMPTGRVRFASGR